MPTRCWRKSASTSRATRKPWRCGATPARTCRASVCTSRADCAAAWSRRRAPRQYTQHARNPARSVIIGGKHTVFAPAYGSPFVHDLDRGRRYGTIEDFRNFVQLAYSTPYLHHSGGTVCEPVDLPVNKRHFDMVYAHMRYSDKPFMGSVTAPERAADTVNMARILFGDDWIDPADRPAEDRRHQPDQRQLAADLGRHHAGRGQGIRPRQPGLPDDAVHPGRRDVAGDGRGHRDGDAGRGAGRHGVRATGQPRRSGDLRQLRVVDVDEVGRARPSARRSRRSCCTSWRPWRAALGVPFRSGGGLVRLQGAGRAGGVRERRNDAAGLPGRHQLRSAHRRLARGRAGNGL